MMKIKFAVFLVGLLAIGGSTFGQVAGPNVLSGTTTSGLINANNGAGNPDIRLGNLNEKRYACSLSGAYKFQTLAAAYADLPASGGIVEVCSGHSETLAQDLKLSISNAGFFFDGPATITMGTFRVIKAGTVGRAFIESLVHSGAVNFIYSGSGHAFDLGDTTMTTLGLSLKSITVTLSNSASVAFYLSRVTRYSLDDVAVLGPGGAVSTLGIVYDGTGDFTGDGTTRFPFCSGVFSCLKFMGSGLNAGNANIVFGGQQVSPATGDIAIDFEAASTGNVVIDFDVETSSTAVKFGASASANYVSIWHSSNTTDFSFSAGSTDNVGAAIGPPSVAPIVSGSGINNAVIGARTRPTTTIASGTAAMTTAAITAGNCGATVTVPAIGVRTTDTIIWAFNAAPAGTDAGLVAWPTLDNVNFAYCGIAETPAAATINWRVAH